MSVQQRNNVHVSGQGPLTMIFAHGFGCDQNMWRRFVPDFAPDYRIVLFDLTGSGKSNLASYDRNKYSTLHGYAADLLEIIDEFAKGPVVYVGHSVSAMIGMLAANQSPERFFAQVMVGPSPRYINDGDYIGGFSRGDIDDLLETLETNYLGWSHSMAPTIMGSPDQPELGIELADSLCRTDPDIARHFARVTFLSDHRADLPRVTLPTLIVQSSDDLLVPLAVSEYMQRSIPGSVLRVIENVGHCPHLSAPCASVEATEAFLRAMVP